MAMSGRTFLKIKIFKKIWSNLIQGEEENNLENYSVRLGWVRIQARIAQLSAYRLGTREFPGSNPCKGENFSVKISNWIVRI